MSRGMRWGRISKSTKKYRLHAPEKILFIPHTRNLILIWEKSTYIVLVKYLTRTVKKYLMLKECRKYEYLCGDVLPLPESENLFVSTVSAILISDFFTLFLKQGVLKKLYVSAFGQYQNYEEKNYHVLLSICCSTQISVLDPDPLHFGGSGSTSWNYETDPVWILVTHKKIYQNYMNIKIFL